MTTGKALGGRPQAFQVRMAFMGAALSLGTAFAAAPGGTNLWHYAQMDFELYRLEAMRDEARCTGMSIDHPGRLPEGCPCVLVRGHGIGGGERRPL